MNSIAMLLPGKACKASDIAHTFRRAYRVRMQAPMVSILQLEAGCAGILEIV